MANDKIARQNDAKQLYEKKRNFFFVFEKLCQGVC